MLDLPLSSRGLKKSNMALPTSSIQKIGALGITPFTSKHQMQGLRNPEKRGVHLRTPQGRGMSVTQPFGYAQGREPVERQMVSGGESGWCLHAVPQPME